MFPVFRRMFNNRIGIEHAQQPSNENNMINAQQPESFLTRELRERVEQVNLREAQALRFRMEREQNDDDPLPSFLNALRGIASVAPSITERQTIPITRIRRNHYTNYASPSA